MTTLLQKRAWWFRSKALRQSFERALLARTTRSAVLALQSDFTRETKLSDIHRRQLLWLVQRRLKQL